VNDVAYWMVSLRRVSVVLVRAVGMSRTETLVEPVVLVVLVGAAAFGGSR
jgi:hypothetical protein